MPQSSRTARLLSILAVGDFGRAEFRGPRAMLDRFGHVAEAATLPEAAQQRSAAAAADDPPPAIDVVVLAQGYPGCLAAADVDRLRRLAPTARMIALCGSWCEGEGRSGQPPPGVIRVYWHQWTARVESELARMAAGEASTWSLPPTAGDDEPFLVLADEPLPRGAGRVIVVADEFDMRDWLLDALRAAGFTATESVDKSDESPAALVYDAHWAVDRACDELHRLAAAWPQSPIVALAGFPRQDEVEAMMAAGASVVVSKPIVLPDLLADVVRAGRSPRRHGGHGEDGRTNAE